MATFPQRWPVFTCPPLAGFACPMTNKDVLRVKKLLWAY